MEDPNVYISYSGIVDLENADGTPMFKRSIDDYSALPDGWKLYRKLLASHPDHPVKIISIGLYLSCVMNMVNIAWPIFACAKIRPCRCAFLPSAKYAPRIEPIAIGQYGSMKITVLCDTRYPREYVMVHIGG